MYLAHSWMSYYRTIPYRSIMTLDLLLLLLIIDLSSLLDFLQIQLGTKKSPPFCATFFVLSISLSLVEFEWKNLYRWKAEMLNFFIV